MTKIIKRLSVILMLMLTTLPSRAEALTVQMMEGEIRGGFTVPVESYHGGSPAISMELGIEGRYNFEDTPLDCGLMLALTTASRNFAKYYHGATSVMQNNRTLVFAVTGDYNFRQGKTFNPFIGTALGIGYNDTVGDRVFPSSGTSFVFMPRGGIEIAHFIRIMGEFNVCRKGYNNFSLTIGLVLGGRPKKN